MRSSAGAEVGEQNIRSSAGEQHIRNSVGAGVMEQHIRSSGELVERTRQGCSVGNNRWGWRTLVQQSKKRRLTRCSGYRQMLGEMK